MTKINLPAFLTASCLVVSLYSTSERKDAFQELPDENDNFYTIHSKNKVFVDKSAYIPKLLNRESRFLRLCRPRRFGKSNFLQTLNAFFKGEKQFFDGFANRTSEYDWQAHPIIYLDFNILNVSTFDAFQADVNSVLLQTGKSYNIELDEGNSAGTNLCQLVDRLSKGGNLPQSVVVLVDEYDWPVRFQIEAENGDEAQKISTFLRKFFALFRRLTISIRLLFLTCTMQLKLVDEDTGEGLKTLTDITFDPEFDGMIGLTHAELVSHFEPHINAMTKSTPNETFHSLVESLKKHYNGYCFSRNTSSACRLFNFHSVIACLRNQKFDYSWHASGRRPYDVIEDFRKRKLTTNVYINRTISREYLQRPYDYDDAPPMVICLILEGYLTFRSYDEKYDEYEVDFPNEEIRETFIKEMMKTVPGGRWPIEEILSECKKIKKALVEANSERFVELLNNIAFEAQGAEVDNYSLTERVSRVLQTCDVYCIPAHNHFGDIIIDLVIQLLEDEREYVLQFDQHETAGHAIEVLLNLTEDKAFRETFEYNSVYLMGVHFGGPGGRINEWVRVSFWNKECSDLKASHSNYLEMFSYINKSKKCIRTVE